MSPHANGPAPVQRLRVTFAVCDAARYVSHLDLTRAWVRALRRLGAPLAYTHGFNPRPRVSVAAPLPVGFGGERELLDVYLDAPLEPRGLAGRLQAGLPAGLVVRGIEEVPLQAPPLPSQLQAADYVVSFLEPPPEDLERRVGRLMAAESLPFTRKRQGREVRFDLRPRVLQAEVEERDGQAALRLRLIHGAGGAARPEDVVSALGLDPAYARATRIGLVLAAAGGG
jgi:radical SAM-linked protein